MTSECFGAETISPSRIAGPAYPAILHISLQAAPRRAAVQVRLLRAVFRRRRIQQRNDERDGEDGPDDQQRRSGGQLDELVEQHLQADEDEDPREPRLEIAQAGERAADDEIERA